MCNSHCNGAIESAVLSGGATGSHLSGERALCAGNHFSFPETETKEFLPVWPQSLGLHPPIAMLGPHTHEKPHRKHHNFHLTLFPFTNCI